MLSKPLHTVDAESLLVKSFDHVPFLVDGLLTSGLYILAGAPKIGKSWLTLWLCMQVATGGPVWKFSSQKSTVLYLCLEDHAQRIQSRLSDLIGDSACDFSSLYFSMEAQTLSPESDSGLLFQLELFVQNHPDTRLIAIDTLQRIRRSTEINYGTDYEEIALLRQFADHHQLTLLLVHHLRKMKDDDPLNRISGTTGITGAADGTFVLCKSKRFGHETTLACTGRDIEDREPQLSFNRDTLLWSLLSDSVTDEPLPSEELVEQVVIFLSAVSSFSGTAAKLSEVLQAHCGVFYPPNTFSKNLRSHATELLEHHVTLRSSRTHDRRILELTRVSCVSNDGCFTGGEIAAATDAPTAEGGPIH